MSNPHDVRIQEVSCEIESVVFRTPLKFGGRVVSKAELLNVFVTVERRDGHLAEGFGSMPLGNIWAWPTDKVEPETTLEIMKKFGEEVARIANAYTPYGHALEISFQLSAEYYHLGRTLPGRMGHDVVMPELAQLVAASPFDAALHDAYGRAQDLNSYNTLSSEFMNEDLAFYLDDQFEGEYLDKYTLREPTKTLPLYHLVGALDPLTDGDIENRIGDGMPETLGEWIKADGLTHLKIKLAGDDLEWDVNRVISIDRVASEVQAERGCTEWYYSCDFNEKCANVQYVLDFLNRIREVAAPAFDRIQYIEQPTSRDLKANPGNKMHEAAKIKPIVIDEALTDYEALLLAREQGYSGVALKACKGQTESLFMAAAAQKFGMFLCVQDLTCPGYSFLHSSSLAARIPGVAAIEGNGRQFCPAGNKKLATEFPSMFKIKNGTVDTGVLNGEGLGF
ncbi:hypothetical protein Pla110_13130 [Polystyrenella longa]|uniref:Enolase C-terminal domain-containing protein n=1 Tax=Polystyrenella longa TaxID=2528007 RepID=A0A518CK55_9PLAN|nr:enolase C-terminal domain-like protein [Polystyrenella longa]QDU79602.1 hypothetical protein Pla110_13130 [Polystyrenella longa]